MLDKKILSILTLLMWVGWILILFTGDGDYGGAVGAGALVLLMITISIKQ